MHPYSCLAIDMGASNIRLILGIFGKKEIELREIYRFSNEMKLIDGHYRWDIDYIRNEIKEGIFTAKKAHTINSIGTDSWGVDFVLMDKNGEALEWPVAYRDGRTGGMKENWEKRMSQAETFERTGINYYPFNSLYQFLSVSHTQMLNRADRILFMANYVTYYLSGIAINELTLSSTSQMLNVHDFEWDEVILKKLGLHKKQFQSPVKAGTVIGPLAGMFQSPETKVALAPAHDSACAVVSIPARTTNFAFISTGTWCVTGVKTNQPFTSELAFNQGITNEITAEGTFRVLKNLMGLWLIQGLHKSLRGEFSYAEMEAMAWKAEPFKYLINPNDPLFYHPENMTDAFDNYLMDRGIDCPGSPGEYIRCAYDSLGFSFRHTLDVFEKIRGYPFDVLHVIGGGCQSAILCQLTANATGLDVYAGPVEGAAIGNMIIQAQAMEVIPDASAAVPIIERSFDINHYRPEISNQQEEKYREFLSLR